MTSEIQRDGLEAIPKSDASIIAMLEDEARELAGKFLDDLAETNSLPDRPYYQDLEFLAEKGRKLPCKLPAMDRIERTLEEASEWKKSALWLFSRRFLHQDLHECITPRVQEDDVIFNTNSYMCADYILDAYRKAEVAEIDLIKRLRERNNKESKSGLGWFCVCSGDLEGPMHKCELCHGWFHDGCVKITTQFLCPYCSRTRRPRLAALLPLVETLRGLGVRLPEGDALVSMVDRAMRWKEIVRYFFQVAEVDEYVVKSAVLKKGETKNRIPVSDEMRSEIDELLIEGFLLEIHLDDVEKLWKIGKFIREDPFSRNFDEYLKENPLPSLKTSPINLPEIRFVLPSHDELESEEPEQEACSAEKCVRPKGEAITWIQCEGDCSRWFHMICVKIDKDEVGPKDLYYCFDCRMSILPKKLADRCAQYWAQLCYGQDHFYSPLKP